MDESARESRKEASRIVGIAVLTLFLVGLGGIVLAFIAVARHDYMGAGLCLIASALALGLLANASLRG